MLNDDLLDSLGMHDLLPAPLAAWRPLLSEALAFFLERLPPPRLAAIVAHHLALDEDAGSPERLVTLLSQCPCLHKLGQVVARHRLLHPELRRLLQSLESMPATLPIDAVAARIREELAGDPPVTLADAALAEGSVAVVVPFTYCDNATLRHGVFKLLKPGVETKLTEELAILADLGRFLEARSRHLKLPALDYRDTLKSVETLLACEIRLDVEQQNLRAAAAFYAAEPRVLVPQLLPWCTPRLTAMERVFGVRITDAALDDGRRQRLAATMMSALLAQPFWSRSAKAVFHADLHGGNLFLADDGRLAVLDWSLTTSLTKVQREALVGVALAGLTLDAPRIRRSIAALGSLAADDRALGAAVDRALDRLVLQGRLPGFDWLLALLDDIALRTAGGFQGNLALFRKTWLSLSGVIADLAGEQSPDIPLLALATQRFVAELPARLVARPDSQAFSTHVSTADVLRTCASPWLASLRYWTRYWTHALGAPDDRAP
jgi:ubiquinone biosynthesis protein